MLLDEVGALDIFDGGRPVANRRAQLDTPVAVWHALVDKIWLRRSEFFRLSSTTANDTRFRDLSTIVAVKCGRQCLKSLVVGLHVAVMEVHHILEDRWPNGPSLVPSLASCQPAWQ